MRTIKALLRNPHIRNNWSKDIFCASERETKITSNFEPRNLPQPQETASRQTHTKMSRRKLLFKLTREQISCSGELLNVPPTLKVLECKLNRNLISMQNKSFIENKFLEKTNIKRSFFLRSFHLKIIRRFCRSSQTRVEFSSNLQRNSREFLPRISI